VPEPAPPACPGTCTPKGPDTTTTALGSAQAHASCLPCCRSCCNIHAIETNIQQDKHPCDRDKQPAGAGQRYRPCKYLKKRDRRMRKTGDVNQQGGLTPVSSGLQQPQTRIPRMTARKGDTKVCGCNFLNSFTPQVLHHPLHQARRPALQTHTCVNHPLPPPVLPLARTAPMVNTNRSGSHPCSKGARPKQQGPHMHVHPLVQGPPNCPTTVHQSYMYVCHWVKHVTR
jgi:hypothetical protein